MNTSLHTPSPWDLTWGKFDAAIHNGGTIAVIEDTMAGWKANARLIAAAPDLLNVVSQVLPWLEVDREINHGHMSQHDLSVLDGVIADARSALDLATNDGCC